MMASGELQEHLTLLGLDQLQAAQLLSVTPRTLRRWLAGEEVRDQLSKLFEPGDGCTSET